MYLIVTALLVAGCAASTVAPEDPQVVSDVLPFIRDGKTSRNEVLRRLGDPDYRHEGGRIVAYKMWMCAREEQVPFSSETRCRDSGAAGNTCLSSVLTNVVPQGSSKGAGVISPSGFPQFYYRVTSRVLGPRNTASYVQTLIYGLTCLLTAPCGGINGQLKGKQS